MRLKKGEFDNSNTFQFTALRGIQAGREYYIVMCPLRLIPRMFLFNELEIPPRLRAQRKLNKARIPEMASYITQNNMDYTFSSLTASIDGNVEFIPMKKEGHFSKMGILKVPMNSRFLINDGQHRRAAIEHALEQKPELAMETISVVFYLDKGLRKSQQMFSDLNKHAVRPSTSLNILYDHRDSFSEALRSIINEIPIFANDLTELEKTSISNRAHKVFTLNSIYNSTKDFLGKKEKKPTITEKEKNLVKEYWNQVYHNIKQWQDVVNGKVSPYDLRKEYVHVYGIVLHSLGRMGNELIQKYPKSWKSKLSAINNINWKRTNVKAWEGRSMISGRLSKMRTNIVLTTNFLKNKVGLKLSKEENKLEKNLRKR
tara:strand:+ start:1945 stop:3060 length:1116 start_codon:yes stop_codon:yes gene_type:complete